MIEKIKRFMRKERMVDEHGTVVVGVSGGADSVCLLLVLLKICEQLDIELVPVHINHQLRGEESEADQKYVEEMCRERGLAVRIFKEDVQGFSDNNKISLEEAGRMVRREILERVANEHKSALIALGHHINDKVETSLMNQCRGTGITGVASIRPVQGNYIRPLLCVTRGEIENFLEDEQVGYCIDSSNLGNDYTRNRIRNLILPEMEKHINPNTVQNMNYMIDDMREIYEFLNIEVEKGIEETVEYGEKYVLIRNESYGAYHTIIKRELIKALLIKLAGKSKDISRVHIEDVQKLFCLQVGKQVHLPYGIIARRVQAGVEMRNESDWKSESDFSCISLNVPGKTLVEEKWVIESSVLDVVEIENILDTHYTKYFDYDIIKDKLLVDKVNMSDHMIINAQGGRQSIKKYCKNQKIDYHIRTELINIRDESDVYWILGHRRSCVGKVTDKTKKILKIQIGGKENGRKN